MNHESGGKDDTPPQTWRDRAGQSVLDPNDPHGHPIQTPTDRRWLWLVAVEMGSSSDKELWPLAAALDSYLGETCEHHWLSYDADEYMPAHRRCLWCHRCAGPAEPEEQPGAQDRDTEEGRCLAAAQARVKAATDWAAAREGRALPDAIAEAAVRILAAPSVHGDVRGHAEATSVYHVGGHLVVVYSSGNHSEPVAGVECSCPGTGVCEHLLAALAYGDHL